MDLVGIVQIVDFELGERSANVNDEQSVRTSALTEPLANKFLVIGLKCKPRTGPEWVSFLNTSDDDALSRGQAGRNKSSLRRTRTLPVSFLHPTPTLHPFPYRRPKPLDCVPGKQTTMLVD